MPVKIFFCYAREDQRLLEELKSHLLPMQHNGLIEMWYDQNISAGGEWKQEIANQINAANLILLLISRNFMSSNYCYGVEMKRAMERHEQKEAKVIPIILQPTFWQNAPFGKLQALPKNARPVTHRSWGNRSEAFLSIAEGIHEVVVEISTQPAGEELFNELVLKIQELRGTQIEYDKLIKLLHDKKNEQRRKELFSVLIEQIRTEAKNKHISVSEKERINELIREVIMNFYGRLIPEIDDKLRFLFYI